MVHNPADGIRVKLKTPVSSSAYNSSFPVKSIRAASSIKTGFVPAGLVAGPDRPSAAGGEPARVGGLGWRAKPCNLE